jgi:hypothetical protein
VPGPSVDLLALLRPQQVTVTVAGRPFTLSATTAAQWLGAMATDLDNLYGLVPGLISDDDLDDMDQLARTHPDIAGRWFWAARTALGRAGGRDWWWTYNLSKKALSVWMYINGTLLRQGVDSKTMALPDWLDACYTLLWSGGDEEQRIKLDLELSIRPRGLPIKQSRRDVRAMMAEFAAD